jgi:outer membrane protein assembly factor BamA
MLAVGYSRFEDRNGGSFSFDRYGLDLRGAFPLGSEQRVLALRTYLNIDRPAAGSRVPFYLQESLGSSHTLRGFESFRFRGEKLLLLQAEYRWEAAPWAELALFADAGTVARDDSSLELSRLEADWGIGLRFKGERFTFLRLDLAFSREKTSLVTRFSSSF